MTTPNINSPQAIVLIDPATGLPYAAGSGSGDASGPASSTDNAIARFDGTGGKTLQDSGVTISDTNVLTVPGGIASTGGVVTITTSNDSGLAVGVNGATNPALQVDTNAANAATGVKITATAAAAAPQIAAISSGTNENLSLAGKGTGLVLVGPRAAATASSGAATCNAQIFTITTESLTTAAQNFYTLTLTNSFVTTAAVVICSVRNGSNTNPHAIVAQVTEGSGSVVITIKNDVSAVTAFDGTLVIKGIVH